MSAEQSLTFCDGQSPAFSVVSKSGRMVSVRHSHRVRTHGVMWSLSKAKKDGGRGVGESGAEGPSATVCTFIHFLRKGGGEGGQSVANNFLNKQIQI